MARVTAWGRTLHFARWRALCYLLPGLRTSVTDTGYEAFRARIRKLPEQGDIPALALLGEGVSGSIRLDFPRSWSAALLSPTEPDSAVDLLLVEKGGQIPLWGRGGRSLTDKSLPDWPHAQMVVQEGLYSVIRLPCRVETRQGQAPTKAIMLWYPSFEAVVVSPEQVLGFLAKSNLSYYPIMRRYQAKLEVFSQMKCAVAAGSTAEETRRIRETFKEAIRRFGGQMILLLPRDS